MKFLSADWLLKCNETFDIIQHAGIVFNDKIIDVDTILNLKSKYPKINQEYCGKNSVLLPGLINSHIHLEFCANKTSLEYGNFVQWLNSVIEYRDDIINRSTKNIINFELKKMLKSGTTTIGAISSYGFDMEPCVKSPINSVYFIEAIGSKADMIDTLFSDFKARLEDANRYVSDNFMPAIAIHSPYSVHPFLIREVLNIARSDNMVVSTHFQESKEENDWLNYNKGNFFFFFKNLFNQEKSLTKTMEFLSLFKGIENLSFTHCVQANKEELEQIKNFNASIIHCPTSNRLLNNEALNLKHINGINLAFGTDGLSSNYSLNLFEEMRNALFIHKNIDLNIISKALLTSATKGGAKALGLKKGVLQKKFDADLISIVLPDNCTIKNITQSIILHTNNVQKTYIRGKQIELT